MSDKILLVLGASSEIGLGVIEEIYSQYDMIIAHYNSSKDGLEKLKEKIGNKIEICQADFSNEHSTDNFIDKIKSQYKVPTHILHLPALRVENNRFCKIKWSTMQDGFDVQVRSIFKILTEFLPIMSKNKYGKVVFLLSSYTVNTPPKFLAEYVTLKYALLGLMKSLAIEYADKFININAVSPSMIETKFLENIPSLMIQQNAMNHPMKRNAKLEDIMPCIRLLLSDESNYITGQNIVVSGGSSM